MSAKKSEMLSVMGTIWEIVRAIWNAVLELGGTDEDMRNVLKVETLANDLALVILGRADVVAKTEPLVSYLRSLTTDVKLVITATDGTATIAQAKDVFPGYISPDFKSLGLDVPGEAKLETPVQVPELVKDGTFAKFFGSFGADLDSLCLTQNQIIRFVQDHQKWLRADGYATFFLFKVNGEFFVADVYWYGSGLKAYVYRFSDDFVWNAEYRHRVVVPQLPARP